MLKYKDEGLVCLSQLDRKQTRLSNSGACVFAANQQENGSLFVRLEELIDHPIALLPYSPIDGVKVIEFLFLKPLQSLRDRIVLQISNFFRGSQSNKENKVES